MATNLGRVGMVMKGAWSSSATYETLDTVSYNNALYTAKQNVPANTLPTNTTYWQAAIDGAVLLTSFVMESKLHSNITLDDNAEVALDISKTGYSPMGILGLQFPSTDRSKIIGIKQWYIDELNNTFVFQIAMNASTSGNVITRVLYKKI